MLKYVKKMWNMRKILIIIKLNRKAKQKRSRSNTNNNKVNAHALNSTKPPTNCVRANANFHFHYLCCLSNWLTNAYIFWLAAKHLKPARFAWRKIKKIYDSNCLHLKEKKRKNISENVETQIANYLTIFLDSLKF